jgi:hypothetical protein
MIVFLNALVASLFSIIKKQNQYQTLQCLVSGLTWTWQIWQYKVEESITGIPGILM